MYPALQIVELIFKLQDFLLFIGYTTLVDGGTRLVDQRVDCQGWRGAAALEWQVVQVTGLMIGLTETKISTDLH